MRIAILTSGGDVPALNCCIRAAALACYERGHELIGIHNATEGLATRTYETLTPNTCSINGYDPMMTIGGTVLGSCTAGIEDIKTEDILAGYKELGIDALIGIGGDGSLQFISKYAKLGNWNVVAVPKTIDNDVPLTRAIGFDTAVNTVVDCIDKLKQTASSHNRYMIVETMGRTAGHLALYSGIAAGVDAILIPERCNNLAELVIHLKDQRDQLTRKSGIIVVAEGCRFGGGTPGNQATKVAYALNQLSINKLDIRTCVLGHLQRGGQPTAFDRMIATGLGAAAVSSICDGVFNVMTTWQNGRVGFAPLSLVYEKQTKLVEPDDSHVKMAKDLGIFI